MFTGRRWGGVSRDVALADHDAARVGPLEAGDHPQRRRLTAARRAEQREELAASDLERDVVDGGDLVERLLTPLDGDRLRAERRHCASSRRMHDASSSRAALAIEQAEVDDRVEPVGGRREPPAGLRGIDRRGTEPSSTSLVEQSRRFDRPTPGSAPARAVAAPRRSGGSTRPRSTARASPRALARSCAVSARSARSAPGRECRELDLERRDAEVLRVRERGAQELLPRREVVVDEGPRHAGLLAPRSRSGGRWRPRSRRPGTRRAGSRRHVRWRPATGPLAPFPPSAVS